MLHPVSHPLTRHNAHTFVSDTTLGNLQWSTWTSLTVCFPHRTHNSTLQITWNTPILESLVKGMLSAWGLLLHLVRCDVLFCITVCLWCRAVLQTNTKLSQKHLLPSVQTTAAEGAFVMVSVYHTTLRYRWEESDFPSSSSSIASKMTVSTDYNQMVILHHLEQHCVIAAFA